MFIAAAIVSVLLAAVLAFSAYGKLTGNAEQVETLQKVGVPADKVPFLAAAEIAGAVGLIAGLFWWPIGAAAAVGVILYFIGAVTAHLRVKDKAIAPAAVLGVVAVATLILGVAAA